MRDSLIVRPTWAVLIPLTLFMLLMTVGLVGTSVVIGAFFGVVTLIFLLAWRDHISFEGDLPRVTTRRWFVVPLTFEVPAMAEPFRAPGQFRSGYPLKEIRVGQHRAQLWMYVGRQEEILARLSAGPARVGSSTTRPNSTGRSARPRQGSPDPGQ